VKTVIKDLPDPEAAMDRKDPRAKQDRKDHKDP
jgi:hypothetical protein